MPVNHEHHFLPAGRLLPQILERQRQRREVGDGQEAQEEQAAPQANADEGGERNPEDHEEDE